MKERIMRVKFVIDGRTTLFTRDIPYLPRISECVVHHEDGPGVGVTGRYKVLDVTYAYEDREWYKNRVKLGDVDLGDGIFVTLELIGTR